MKDNAGQTKRLEDWEAFSRQRAKVLHLVKSSRDAFFANNPGQEVEWLPVLALEASRVTPNCANCEWDFGSEQELAAHESQHQTCNLDGCTFTAAAKPLEIHILHMHSSGLYNRVHQGDSPEDIAKWRAERKKNYPSVAKSEQAAAQKKVKDEMKQRYLERLKKRAEEIEIKRREKAQELREKRNEKAAKSQSNKRAKRRNNNRRDAKIEAAKENQDKDSAAAAAKVDPDQSEEEEEEELPVWFGKIKRFKGTVNALHQRNEVDDDDENQNVECDFHISDDEWQTNEDLETVVKSCTIEAEQDKTEQNTDQEPRKNNKVDDIPEINKTITDAATVLVNDTSSQNNPSKRKVDQTTDDDIVSKKAKVEFDPSGPSSLPGEHQAFDAPNGAGGSNTKPVKGEAKNALIQSDNHYDKGDDLVSSEKDAAGQSKEDAEQVQDVDGEEGPPPEEIAVKKVDDDLVIESSDLSKKEAEPIPPTADNNVGQELVVNEDDDDNAPPEECSSKTSTLPSSTVATSNSRAEKTAREVDRRLLRRSKRPPTLLERLLKQEINQERNELLQCLRFVCSQNFFNVGHEEETTGDK